MSASDLVPLRGRPPVPLAAIQLALDLERRGFSMQVDAAGLMVAPREQLTEEDRAAIRQHRADLMAIVAYVDSIQ